MAAPGGLDYSRLPAFGTTKTPEEEVQQRGLIRAGLSSGIDDLQGLGGSAIQGAGTLLGLPGVTTFGRNIAERNIAESAANGRADLEIAPWKDGGAPVLPWLGYQASKQVPLIATYLLGGKAYNKLGGATPQIAEDIGMALPRALGGGGLLPGASVAVRRAAVQRGARQAGRELGADITGGAVAGIPIAFGSMVQEADQKEGGATLGDVQNAALLSPVYSALDAVQPAAFKGLFKRGQEGNIFRRVATAAFASAAAEVPQEGLQTALEQTFRPDLSLKDKMANIVDAAVTGGAVGGVFGGIGGLRAMKRINPAEMTNEDMISVIDEKLGMSPSGPLGLPSPTAYGNAAGDVGIGEASRAELRGEFPPILLSPESAGQRSAVDGSTMVVGRNREGGRYAPGMSAVEQPPLEDTSRSYRNWTTPELREAINVLNNQREAGTLKPGWGEMLAPMQDELNYRNEVSTNNDVTEDSAGAERRELDQLRGATEQSSATPVPVNSEFDRDTILKGISTRKSYSDAKTRDELETVLRARLEAGTTAKGDFILAERLGIDTNAPAAPVETTPESTSSPAPQATVATPEPAAPANLEGGDFAAKWKADVQRMGQKDKGARSIKPTSTADAQVQLYRALGREGEIGDGLEKLAQEYGILDANKQLTPLAVQIAKQDPIPTEQVVKAAVAQGFKGAQASMFDRGAKAYLGGEQIVTFRNDDQRTAYLAGQTWAEQHNSVPRGALKAYAPGNAEVTEAQQRLGAPVRVTKGSIPAEQKRMQLLNRELEQRQARGELTADEVVPIKRLVASGAIEIDDAVRYTKSGRGALLTENPQARKFQPAVAERGGTAERAIARSRILQAQLRIEQEINDQKNERESAEAIERHAARQALRDRIARLGEEVDAEIEEASGIPSGLEIDELGRLRPYRLENGKWAVSATDKFFAAVLLQRIVDSDGSSKALADILRSLPGPVGAMSKKMLRNIPDFRVSVVSREQMDEMMDTPTAGFFDHDQNWLVLAADIEHVSVALHETIHAIIDGHITKGTEIGKEIRKIFQLFKSSGRSMTAHSKTLFKYKYDYAFTDPYEFMAEFLSREQVREYIENLTAKGKVGNLFQRIWAAIRKALGHAPQDYITRIMELAEAAASNPLADDGRQLPSPMIMNERAKTIVQSVNRIADSTTGLKTFKDKALKLLVGWAPMTHLTEHYKRIFPEQQLLQDAHAARRATTAVFAHLYNAPKLLYETMSQTKEGQAAIRTTDELMELTAWDIDYSKSWADNDHLHGADNEDVLKRLHERGHRQYNALVGNKQNALIDTYRQLNEMEHFASMALAIRQLASVDLLSTDPIPAFANDPVEVFRNDSKLHNAKAARTYWRGVLQDEITAVEDHIASIRGTATPATLAKLTPLERYIKETKKGVASMDNAPYFHLGRSGEQSVFGSLRLGEDKKVDLAAVDHVAKELEKIGVTDARITRDLNKPQIFLRVDSIERRNLIAAKMVELQKQGWLNPDIDIAAGPREQGEFLPERTRQEMNKFVNAYLSDPMFDVDDPSLTPAEKTSIVALRDRARRTAYDVWLDMLPDTATSKVLTHRESKPGYSKDMARSFAFRYNIAVNSIASLAAEPALNEAFEKMRGRLKDARVVNTKQDVDTIATLYAEHARREAERPLASEVDGYDTWRAWTHAFYLGLSPSYMLVNMTQLGVLLWPELAKKHGFVDTARAMAKVTPIAFNILKATMSRGYEAGGFLRAADGVITQEALQEALGTDKPTTEFLMNMIGSGIIDIGSAARELATVAEGRENSAQGKALRFAAAAGLYSETLTRLIAALTARELHNSKISESPIDYAKSVVRESMLEYSTWNTARKMGKMGIAGNFTPVMMSFLQYSTQVTWKLYRELNAAFLDGAATDREKREARQFLLQHAIAVTALAGTMGLPFATVIAAVVEKMVDAFDDDDEPFDATAAWRNYLAEVFGPEIGEMAARGLPRAGGYGIDLSSRAGEQNLFPMSQWLTDRRKFKDASEEAALRSLGAPVSMAGSIAEGFGKIADGDFTGGMIAMMPNAFKGPANAWKMSDQGYVDTLGNKLPMEPSTEALLAQVLGFTPSPKAEYSEARTDQSSREGVMIQRAKLIRNNLIKALDDGTPAEQRAAFAAALAFDNSNPAYAVLPDIKSSMRRRARLQAISEATNTPIGVNPKDIEGRNLTRYANIEFRAQ